MLTILLIFQFLRSLAISAEVTNTVDACPDVSLDLSQMCDEITLFSSLFRLNTSKNVHDLRKQPETALVMKSHPVEGRKQTFSVLIHERKQAV